MVNCTEEVMAQHVFDVLSDYVSLESIKALLANNTSVNTDGKNLHTVRCALHQNELTFQSLFKKLDDATAGPQKF